MQPLLYCEIEFPAENALPGLMSPKPLLQIVQVTSPQQTWEAREEISCLFASQSRTGGARRCVRLRRGCVGLLPGSAARIPPPGLCRSLGSSRAPAGQERRTSGARDLAGPKSSPLYDIDPVTEGIATQGVVHTGMTGAKSPRIVAATFVLASCDPPPPLLAQPILSTCGDPKRCNSVSHRSGWLQQDSRIFHKIQGPNAGFEDHTVYNIYTKGMAKCLS
ncbi:uncharacterized protein [Pleurodeles waltl]|uniref:uncharacterized protein isoform X2 n=1 Tax=Pleurodeles waltl TaxID=8319 RepID=UPI00370959FB